MGTWITQPNGVLGYIISQAHFNTEWDLPLHGILFPRNVREECRTRLAELQVLANHLLREGASAPRASDIGGQIQEAHGYDAVIISRELKNDFDETVSAFENMDCTPPLVPPPPPAPPPSPPPPPAGVSAAQVLLGVGTVGLVGVVTYLVLGSKK